MLEFQNSREFGAMRLKLNGSAHLLTRISAANVEPTFGATERLRLTNALDQGLGRLTQAQGRSPEAERGNGHEGRILFFHIDKMEMVTQALVGL